MAAKVLPKDPKYHYSPEVPQGTHYSIAQYTRYSVISAKFQPKDPNCTYPTEVPQGTHYNLIQYR